MKQTPGNHIKSSQIWWGYDSKIAFSCNRKPSPSATHIPSLYFSHGHVRKRNFVVRAVSEETHQGTTFPALLAAALNVRVASGKRTTVSTRYLQRKSGTMTELEIKGVRGWSCVCPSTKEGPRQGSFWKSLWKLLPRRELKSTRVVVTVLEWQGQINVKGVL